ncbi:hypothetical protein [Thermogemmatispora onikobensis]|uniref:hypothetical protein n=1 Tax=Thermogemmatispora onikobensis TaxID=732234 RepID=UPI00114CC205|nr:hypothetical protein [Thermogemmatispora onikobensis]
MNLPPVGREGRKREPYLVICYREEGGDLFLLPATCERCVVRILRELSAEPAFDPFTIVVERGGQEILRMGARRIRRPLGGSAAEIGPGEDG